MLHNFNINPILLDLGFYKITWYGFFYAFGAIMAWIYCLKSSRASFLTKTQVHDLLFYGILGLLIGGRLGDLLFYHPEYLFNNPLTVIEFHRPGRSIHGAIIGTIIGLYFFSKKNKINILAVTDLVSPIAAISIFFGRIGNFINGELWGRVTDVPWAVVFIESDLRPRHPSQLYEALLEGLLLSVVLFYYSRKKIPCGHLTGIAFIGYGMARIIGEFYKEPDGGYGYFFSYFTMGQILSVPLLVLGILIIYQVNKSDKKKVDKL